MIIFTREASALIGYRTVKCVWHFRDSHEHRLLMQHAARWHERGVCCLWPHTAGGAATTQVTHSTFIITLLLTHQTDSLRPQGKSVVFIASLVEGPLNLWVIFYQLRDLCLLKDRRQRFLNLLFSLIRSAKEHILGLSRVSSAGDVEKTDMLADDSVFEEAIIAEYALVINGHSLVSQPDMLPCMKWYYPLVVFSILDFSSVETPASFI